MKILKLLLTITIVPFILASCEQKHNLIAEFEGIENDTIFVEYGTVSNFFTSNGPKRDTIYAQNGKFVYDIPSQEPYFIYFYPKKNVFTMLNGQSFYANQNYIVTLLEPNDNIIIKGKLNKYYASYDAKGSVFNEEYSKLRKATLRNHQKGQNWS